MISMMKLLVPCVLLLALIACVFSAPARFPAGSGDPGEDHGAGFKEVDNSDELGRVARSPGGGGGCPCCYPGGDCSGGVGFKEVDNSNVHVRVARYPVGGDDTGEDHDAGFKEVDNSDILARKARSPADGGDTGEGGAGFTEVDNGDVIDIEEDQGTGFEEVDNGDELLRLVYSSAGGDDYGAYLTASFPCTSLMDGA